MFHPKLRQKMGDVRNGTEQRTRRLREWGFKVVEMWEHEWDGMQGQALLPLGDYLGDLTSELKWPGDFIREFVSTGPKSYAYVTDQGDKEVKCKGIPLNVTSSAVVNFQTMLRLVEGMEEKYVVTEPHRIQRDAKRRQLKTIQMSKDFRVVYDKRIRRGVPYGYLDERESDR
ncbi:hypothetical protein QZH41_009657 [Actinostola sp. cb2023]|nr:hypothetical protein QZH41_009657 [Actinostola sp. cb2023]